MHNGKCFESASMLPAVMAVMSDIDDDSVYAASGAAKDFDRWVRIGESRLSSSMRGRAREASWNISVPLSRPYSHE